MGSYRRACPQASTRIHLALLLPAGKPPLQHLPFFIELFDFSGIVLAAAVVALQLSGFSGKVQRPHTGGALIVYGLCGHCIHSSQISIADRGAAEPDGSPIGMLTVRQMWHLSHRH